MLGINFSFYVPNFEKVGRAYCFWLVCVCVCVGGGGLKLHMHIPHEKIVDPYFFLVQVMPLF